MKFLCFSIEKKLKEKFEQKCKDNDISPSDLLRRYVWAYTDPNGYSIHKYDERQREKTKKYKDAYEGE